jgi:hypothetical protein
MCFNFGIVLAATAINQCFEHALGTLIRNSSPIELLADERPPTATGGREAQSLVCTSYICTLFEVAGRNANNYPPPESSTYPLCSNAHSRVWM